MFLDIAYEWLAWLLKIVNCPLNKQNTFLLASKHVHNMELVCACYNFMNICGSSSRELHTRK